MSTVIIYGGAFNPPTIAHQLIVQALINLARNDQAQVWIVPSGNRRDKSMTTTRQQRIDLVKAMVTSLDIDGVVVRVDPTELDRRIHTETDDTVREYVERYPQHDFRWVFGSDSVATMHQWRGGEQLYRSLQMIVIDRAGYELGGLPARAAVLRVAAPELSSTEVRARLSQGQSVDGMVAPSVLDVIHRQSVVYTV